MVALRALLQWPCHLARHNSDPVRRALVPYEGSSDSNFVLFEDWHCYKTPIYSKHKRSWGAHSELLSNRTVSYNMFTVVITLQQIASFEWLHCAVRGTIDLGVQWLVQPI